MFRWATQPPRKLAIAAAAVERGNELHRQGQFEASALWYELGFQALWVLE